MNQFGMKDFCGMLLVVQGAQHLCSGWKASAGGSTQPHDSEWEIIYSALKFLKSECEKYDLRDTLNQIDNASYLKSDSPLVDRSYSIILAYLVNIHVTFLKELDSRKFLWVNSEYSSFVDQDQLFGQEVWETFPLARNEIRCVGNCIATDCNTAAVFHLMRTIEWGLRDFCAHLEFEEVCIDWKKKKFIPVAFSDWDKILNQLPNAVEKKIDAIKRGAKKQSAQEFYLQSLQDIKAVKDAWRNHVMHTRREYTAEDALAIFGHVKNLMIRLSDRTTRTRNPKGNKS
jgi:hypothetical protein